jgi:hypothetical protein
MRDQRERAEPNRRVQDVDAGKAVSWKDGTGKLLREGVKPSAPANFALPKPVPIPPAPVAGGTKSEDKK